MKKNLLLLVLMLLPLAASADYTVEIDGIYYILKPTTEEAEVTKHPNKYMGDVNGDGEVGIGDIVSITNIMSIRP